MSDMLVNLMNLPDISQLKADLKASGIEVFRAIAPDKKRIVDWVFRNSDENWASECDCSFSQNPSGCFVAFHQGEIIGFAVIDATAPDFFGPTMVLEQYRKRGIGLLLLVESLAAMRQKGYVYAIIGGVGPKEFYQKAVGATVIEGSSPGIYRDFIPHRRKNSPFEY